jgi:hypothetical protein
MRPPPGYPFEGPLQSRPPAAEDGRRVEPVDESSVIGSAGFFLAFIALMMGTGFLAVALMLMRVRAAEDARLAQGHGAVEIAPSMDLGQSTADDPHSRAHPVDSPPVVLPETPRNVPVHPVRFLEGCSEADLHQVETSIDEAVRLGVKLYNDGDILGSYDAYEARARALEMALPAACRGPIEGLATGRRSAAALAGPNERAWAMRDAFDGLLGVIERSRSSGVGNL